MTEAAPEMPMPTAEHEFVLEHTGTWKVACKFTMDPSQPPMEAQATETVEPVGQFWTVSRFESDMMGMPFLGRATFGFEPHTGQYVSTWVDSMTPMLSILRGDRAGDTVTMRGDLFSCATNTILPHRTTYQVLGKDELLFEMFCTMPDGNEMKLMSNHYTRA
ncbi:MAG: DUF1579 family protein [Planctomycetota bacterium]